MTTSTLGYTTLQSMHRRGRNRHVIQNARHRLPERQRQHLLCIDRHYDRVARLDLGTAVAEPEATVAASDHTAVSTHDVNALVVRL